MIQSRDTGWDKVIEISSGATLNLYGNDVEKTYDEITYTGGLITGGNASDGGGVNNLGTFTMTDGEIPSTTQQTTVVVFATTEH